MTPFARRVLGATARIPYGEVAPTARSPQAPAAPAARAPPATPWASNPVPIVIPCHRVVRSGGALGGYTGGVERKELLLAIERGRHLTAMRNVPQRSPKLPLLPW